MAFRAPDSKREEFRKYLERTGVMDALTKVLVSLYEEPEKPTDALDYLRNKLAGDKESVEELRQQLEAANARIKELEGGDQNAEEEKPPEGEEAKPEGDAPEA